MATVRRTVLMRIVVVRVRAAFLAGGLGTAHHCLSLFLGYWIFLLTVTSVVRVMRWWPVRKKVMACILMAYIVMVCGVMACVAMACVVMACMVVAYMVMAYIGMAYIVMVYKVMAYIVMASSL